MKKVLLVVMVVVLLVMGVKNIQKQNEQREQQRVQEYKMCILEQSEQRGWIIRSECSMDYQILDQKAGLEYTQSGYNLYLKK